MNTGSQSSTRVDDEETQSGSNEELYSAVERPQGALKESHPEKVDSHAMTSSLPPQPLEFRDGDEANPRNWNPKKKLAIGMFVNVAGFVATFGTPIYVAGIPGIATEFNLNTTDSILPGVLYAYGLGVGALVASAASEIFGRSIVYKVTLPLCLLFTIMGGVANNYSTLAASRFLSGTLAGPCLSVGAGTLNDMWNLSLEKTGTAFAMLYALLVIYATQVGPMIGGSLITYHTWRWTFWISAIMIGILSMAAFAIPETYAPQILRSHAKKEKLPTTKRGDLLGLFLVSVGRPLHMIVVEPFVLPNGLVLGITQSIVFAYYVTYSILFEEVYNFSPYQVGMVFAPLLVGGLIAIPVIGLFDRLTYQKARAEAIQSGSEVHPEKRLYPAMLSAIFQPISLFWLAWSGRSSIHWIAPALSGVVFGIAYVLNMIAILIYVNDVYAAHYSASVVAALTFLRFTISSSFPLFTVQMVRSLGFAWATSLLGFISVAMIPIPWVFFKWGPNLRRMSKYLKA